MPGEQVGSAFVSIGVDTKALEAGLNASKAKVGTFASGLGANLLRPKETLHRLVKTLAKA